MPVNARRAHRAQRADTGAALGFALLAYMLGVTLIVTLMPFRFAWPEAWRLTWYVGPLDVFANILLFLPLGFLYRYALPRAHRRPVAVAFALGAAASLGIEATQLFEPMREPSPVDVASNASGAALGAALFDRLARAQRLDGRVIGWLALELPLMGLVYLLVPLLWVSALAAHGDPARGLMVLIVGVFGATLLGGLQREYFGPLREALPRHTALFAGLWFVAGAFPSMRWQPLVLCAGAIFVAAWCGWLGSRAHAPGAHNRRFEVKLLAYAAPLYLAYLAAVTLAPLFAGAGEWTLTMGFAESASEQVEILRLLELIAAHTLVGYVAAEVRGRWVARYGDALSGLAAAALVLVAAGEFARGYAPQLGASGARALLLVLAVLYGGWLYYLQRAHVVRLTSRKSSTET